MSHLSLILTVDYRAFSTGFFPLVNLLRLEQIQLHVPRPLVHSPSTTCVQDSDEPPAELQSLWNLLLHDLDDILLILNVTEPTHGFVCHTVSNGSLLMVCAGQRYAEGKLVYTVATDLLYVLRQLHCDFPRCRHNHIG